MEPLTDQQQHALVEIVIDEFGNSLSFADFADALHGLLEDVPGFETSQQHDINQLTQLLWSQYHD